MTIIALLNKIFIYSLIITFILFFYRIIYIFFAFKKDKILKNTDKKGKYLILIPARNESKVIENLLKSIKYQTYDSNLIDCYVIIEDINDKTTEIVNNYDYNIFVRKDLSKQRKGYALDECIKEILANNKHYDAMFIFDADNILENNFIEEMNKCYQQGYQIGVGYRNSLNKSGNWIADCSLLTFSNINTFQNKARSELTKNIIISGTGYYIDFELIIQLNGWPFTSLTEDYELSLWCVSNNIKCRYVPSATYYDEQATTLKVLKNQQVRWIKGYTQARKIYAKEIRKKLFSKEKNKWSKFEASLGVIPNAVALFSIIFYCFAQFVVGVVGLLTSSVLFITCIKNIFIVLLGYYLFLSLYTVLQIIVEHNHIKFSLKDKIKVVIFNPIFINLFIPHAIKALTTKNVGWTPISHGDAITSTETQKILDKEECEIVATK